MHVAGRLPRHTRAVAVAPWSGAACADADAARAAARSPITALRTELDAVTASWADSAHARLKALNATYAGLPNWQRTNVKDFYETQFVYLTQLAANPAPHLEISWTTRFNAFLPYPKADPYNYALRPLPAWALNSTFETDNEGARFYRNVSDAVDTINVMAYDATGLKFNYSTIFTNFALGGADLRKVNMGFEPGEQAAHGVWEGLEKDKEVAQFVKEHNIGGCMIWAMNPSPKQAPTGSKLCPETAAALAEIIQPTYAWGPAPNYTKCDATAGWAL